MGRKTILNISLYSTFTYGLGYQENLLPEYQKKIGNDVILITTDKTRDDQGNIIEVETGESVLENGVKLVRIHTPKVLSLIGIFPSVYSLILKYKPDVIFVHNLCSLLPAQAIRYKKSHPKVLLISDNHQDSGNAGRPGIITDFIYLRYKLHWKRWIKHFYKVYGTTGWRKDFAHEKYGIPYSKLDTLLMGVDSDRMPVNFNKVRADVRQELGISETSFVFVNGGKMNKAKQIIEALEAFEELEDDSAYFIIFGKLFEDVQAKVMQHIAKNDHIIYLGFIEGSNVKNYLIASDMGFFPGRHSVIWEEAIGCGLPCVFGKYPGSNHTDICGNSILVNNSSKEELLAIMKRTICDRQYYKNLKENALKAMDSLSYYTIAQKSIEGCNV